MDTQELIRELTAKVRSDGDVLAGPSDVAVRAAATLASQAAEIEKLRGLLWYAWHEFNAIRARSGAPLDHYGMTTCAEEWWDRMTDEFKAAIGPDAAKPWPSEEAKAAILPNTNNGATP